MDPLVLCMCAVSIAPPDYAWGAECYVLMLHACMATVVTSNCFVHIDDFRYA